MPASNLDVTVTHDCCQRRAFRRRTCTCLCHTVRVTDYSLHEPTPERFSNRLLVWHVRKVERYSRSVGTVHQRADGQYACGQGDITLAVTDDPWEAVLALARWAQT